MGHRLTSPDEKNKLPDGRPEKPAPWRWKAVLLSAYILGYFLVLASGGGSYTALSDCCLPCTVDRAARLSYSLAERGVEPGIALTDPALPPLVMPLSLSAFGPSPPGATP